MATDGGCTTNAGANGRAHMVRQWEEKGGGTGQVGFGLVVEDDKRRDGVASRRGRDAEWETEAD